MEKFSIEILSNDGPLNFDVLDYAYGDDNRCKFEVFENHQFIASFEPDSHGMLHICKNTGKLENPVLHLIADKIESYNL